MWPPLGKRDQRGAVELGSRVSCAPSGSSKRPSLGARSTPARQDDFHRFGVILRAVQQALRRGQAPHEADAAERQAEHETHREFVLQAPATIAPGRRGPSAMARVMSVAACDPELPPVEMHSGTNKLNTSTAAIAFSKYAERREREQLGHEQTGQPHRAFAPNRGERHLQVVFDHRPDGAHAQRVLGGLFPHDVDHVVVRDDADQVLLVVDDWNREKVVVGHFLGHRLLVVSGVDRHQVAFHQVADRHVGLAQMRDQLPGRNGAAEMVFIVDDVDVIDRLQVLGDAAQCLERRADGERFRQRATSVVITAPAVPSG